MGFLSSFRMSRRSRHIQTVMDRESKLLRERSALGFSRYLPLPEELSCSCRPCRKERRQIRAEAVGLHVLAVAELAEPATQAVA